MALEMEAMGEYTRDKVDDFYDILSRDEWKKVEVVCKLTERAHSIAKKLFETKYPTVNLYLDNLQELRVYLVLESKSSCSFTSNMAKKMLTRLDKYWKNVFVLLGIASFLDPRYKMKYIEYLSSKNEGSDGSSEVSLNLDAIHNLYDGYVASDLEKGDPMDVQDVPNSEKEEKEELMRSEEQGCSISSWVQEYKQFTKIDEKSVDSDLDLYLKEAVVNWRQNFSALKWWKANSPEYPILAKMARDILAIPMSVATSTGAYCTILREAKLDRLGRGKDLKNALMCSLRWLFKEEMRSYENETYRVPALGGSLCVKFGLLGI